MRSSPASIRRHSTPRSARPSSRSPIDAPRIRDIIATVLDGGRLGGAAARRCGDDQLPGRRSIAPDDRATGRAPTSRCPASADLADGIDRRAAHVDRARQSPRARMRSRPEILVTLKGPYSAPKRTHRCIGAVGLADAALGRASGEADRARSRRSAARSNGAKPNAGTPSAVKRRSARRRARAGGTQSRAERPERFSQLDSGGVAGSAVSWRSRRRRRARPAPPRPRQPAAEQSRHALPPPLNIGPPPGRRRKPAPAAAALRGCGRAKPAAASSHRAPRSTSYSACSAETQARAASSRSFRTLGLRLCARIVIKHDTA